MGVAIVDYGSGNLNSAQKAFERAARESRPRHDDRGHVRSRIVSGRPSGSCCRVLVRLCGLHAGPCVPSPGLLEALTEAVRRDGKPFLGICVGMQLLATRGHEHGTTEGLDWIAGRRAPHRAKRSRA